MPLHPLGAQHLTRLLAMARLRPPCRILDMGAGAGESLERLQSLGFDAQGIDLCGRGAVCKGDFLRCPFPGASFDALLSECAFFASGNQAAALREAARLLRPGGMLLLGDVCFMELQDWRALLARTGLRALAVEDETAAWRDYYIECLWAGTAEAFCACGDLPKGKCRYYLTVCERWETDGTL